MRYVILAIELCAFALLGPSFWMSCDGPPNPHSTQGAASARDYVVKLEHLAIIDGELRVIQSCSGTLFHEGKAILTARHCGVNTANWVYHVCDNAGNCATRSNNLLLVSPHPEVDATIVFLKIQETQASYTDLYGEDLLAGSGPLTMVGFGLSKLREEGPVGHVTAFSNVATNSTGTKTAAGSQYFFTDTYYIPGLLTRNTTPELPLLVSEDGDSGGPALYGDLIVGIVVGNFSIDNPFSEPVPLFTNIGAILPWIDEQLRSQSN